MDLLIVRARARRSIFALSLALATVLAAALPAAAAATRTLHAFDGVNGAMPSSPLIEADDGWLYGTTSTSGERGYDLDGLIYRISRSGTFQVVHRFDRCDPAGYNPLGSLIQGADGALYGTTSRGGDGNDCVGTLDTRNGAIFRLEPATGVVTSLHTFALPADGMRPTTALVEGSDGALYGTTLLGGLDSQTYPLGRGTIFRLTKQGSFSVLRRFDGCDGHSPAAPLALGSDGRLYGTTDARRCTTGNGTGVIFSITNTGTFRQLHVFGSHDGASPRGRLVQSPDGRFYGVTQKGGAYQAGVVYRISPTGVFEELQEFGSDGGYATRGMEPFDGLTIGPDGAFYGTAQFGGVPIDAERAGVVFRMDAAGKRMAVVKTFSHESDGAGGIQPRSALLAASDGRLYGTTIGGPNGLGTVFRYAPKAKASLDSVSVYPGELWSGDPYGNVTTGRVILDGLAPSGGAVVALRTDRPDVITIPSSVKVGKGWSAKAFTVTAGSQSESVTVTIRATYAGVTRETTLEVYAAY